MKNCNQFHAKNKNLSIKNNCVNSSQDKKMSDRLIKDKNNLEAIKQFAYQVCAEYLGGAWKTIKLEEFKLARLR